MRTPLCVLSRVFNSDYQGIDFFTRALAQTVYVRKIMSLSNQEVLRIIDSITGGLGYTKNDLDVHRVILTGCLIAWAEAVKPLSQVLEIGTGLGRTLYCVTQAAPIASYYTIDSSAEILSIALYRNPFHVFRDALWRDNVYIIYGDAVEVVDTMKASMMGRFDHIIHDGGPTPTKNPRLYSRRFLESLVELLKDGGTLSVFAGRNTLEIDRIYHVLKGLGLSSVRTDSYPGIRIRAIHCIK